MPYLFILASAACSLLIAHFLKISEVKGLRTLNTLTINYLVAAIVAAAWGGVQLNNTLQLKAVLILFCVVVGVFFISNFIVYSKSVHANGVGVTITAMRLSLLVPVLLSVYLYKEYLGAIEIGGVFLVFVALVLLVPQKSNHMFGKLNAGWLLVIIFVLTGFADASLKIYEEEFSMHLSESLFMSLIFTGAFLIGLTACIIRRGPLASREELKLGTMIGIPNLFSSIFLIFALGDISGSIAYPLVNMLSVVGGTALGVLRWNDKVNRAQWLGLALALIAIIILV